MQYVNINFKEQSSRYIQSSDIEKLIYQADNKELSNSQRAAAAYQVAQLYEMREGDEWIAMFKTREHYVEDFYRYAAALDPSLTREVEFKCLQIAADRILQTSIHWITDDNDVEKIYQVGFAFHYGSIEKNVQRNDELAFHYLLAAAQQGHSKAAFLVTEYFEAMKPAVYNSETSDYFDIHQACIETALKMQCLPALLKNQFEHGKAAEERADAAFRLYMLFSEGESYWDIPVNPEKAHAYLFNAAAEGHPVAVEQLEKLQLIDLDANPELLQRTIASAEKNQISAAELEKKLKESAEQAFAQQERDYKDQLEKTRKEAIAQLEISLNRAAIELKALRINIEKALVPTIQLVSETHSITEDTHLQNLQAIVNNSKPVEKLIKLPPTKVELGNIGKFEKLAQSYLPREHHTITHSTQTQVASKKTEPSFLEDVGSFFKNAAKVVEDVFSKSDDKTSAQDWHNKKHTNKEEDDEL